MRDREVRPGNSRRKARNKGGTTTRRPSLTPITMSATPADPAGGGNFGTAALSGRFRSDGFLAGLETFGLVHEHKCFTIFYVSCTLQERTKKGRFRPVGPLLKRWGWFMSTIW